MCAELPMKAQGATEYLVIMSVVLGIALICVALLVWPTGTTKDAKQSQTDIKNKIAVMEYPDLLQGMAAYYKFDEGSGASAADIKSGATADLYVNTWPSGKSNTALGFDGTSSSRGSSSGAYSFQNGITMMMWLNPSSAPSCDLLHIGSYTPTAGFTRFIGNTNSFSWMYADGGYASAGYTYTLPTTAWTHVAVTHTFNSSIKFYINGTLKQTTAGSTSTIGISNEGLSIGHFSIAGGCYNGSIDELMLFSRALSDGEVRFLYEHPGYP